MKLIVCGLSISSAWGNGHATLLRGLFRELHAAGHTVHFYERDTPYYAAHRDSAEFEYVHLHLYQSWEAVESQIQDELSDADVGIVTSYCPDGAAASRLMLATGLPRTVFYDMDTPVTLSRLDAGEQIPYLPVGGLSGFDLVLSYTGGKALDQLQSRLGARRTAPLYGWVDPDAYMPSETLPRYEGHFSYLGTYSSDRQRSLEELFLQPAAKLPDKQFVLGGAMYPDVSSWPSNVRYFDHVSPLEHRFFYSSSPLTLNITRGSMAAMGYCPSGRLFEAAACGTAILSDNWTGLSEFLKPGEEILLAESTSDAVAALQLTGAEISAIGKRARERALDCHTAAIRAKRLLQLIESSGTESLRNHFELTAMDKN